LRGVAVRTPLLPAPWLAEEVGAEVRLKCESFQPIGAFKLRGAYTMVARLDPAERARGVVTYSSGNHAQAVAFAARAFGIDAVIVMPEDAPG
jgi:threo-3-hydroxy-L-aspartate ammonia-lyase